MSVSIGLKIGGRQRLDIFYTGKEADSVFPARRLEMIRIKQRRVCGRLALALKTNCLARMQART